MAESPFGVTASAGSLRAGEGVVLRHAWTPEGVVAGPVENGGQALHLAVALCVLNDVYREAAALDVPVLGVAVHADGGFDEGWASTGIDYRVRVDTPADEETLATLLDRVEQVAEIPRVLRAGAEVRRT
jgi:hypothetical protein